MRIITKITIWIVVPLAGLSLYVHFVHSFQNRFVPPHYITTVSDVLSWTGRPEWVIKYSSATHTYYEIAKKEPVGAMALTLASGPPSYTVDETGRFIGWSSDSGENQSPDVLRSPDLKRERIPVDQFLEQSKTMTPNQAMQPRPVAGK